MFQENRSVTNFLEVRNVIEILRINQKYLFLQ
jgi:hypothetical protein